MSGKVKYIFIFPIPKADGLPADELSLTMYGIDGDHHCDGGEFQISILPFEAKAKMEKMRSEGIKIEGFRANIITEGFDASVFGIGCRIKIGEALIEITGIKHCDADKCEVLAAGYDCPILSNGLYTKVITPGIIKIGDLVYPEKGENDA